jgi:hypothetical protein
MQTALEIDMRPLQFEDFRQARAREQQQANRRQRVEFHALVERCSSDGAKVIAKGFATGGGAADGALVLACGVGGGGRECSGQIVRCIPSRISSRRPRLCLRVQLLVNRFAPEDGRGFLLSRTRAVSIAMQDR